MSRFRLSHFESRMFPAPLLFGSALAAALGLGWLLAARVHGPGSLPGVLYGWALIVASTVAGWLLYRSARSDGRPLLWGLLLQVMRMGAILLAILVVKEIDPSWADPFVETVILGYLFGMAAEVLYLHLSGLRD